MHGTYVGTGETRSFTFDFAPTLVQIYHPDKVYPFIRTTESGNNVGIATISINGNVVTVTPDLNEQGKTYSYKAE